MLTKKIHNGSACSSYLLCGCPYVTCSFNITNAIPEPTPIYVEHKITHFRQRYNWDCGVTCVLMLLSSEQQKELLGSFDQVCAEEGFNQSTWTIDLCYLLKRFVS